MRITIDPATITRNFSLFRENCSLRESAQLFEKGRPILEMIQALAMNGNVLASFAAFEGIYPNGVLGRGVLEKVILAVSQRNNCQFCAETHQAICNKLGIRTNAADIPEGERQSARERVAMEYALAVQANSNGIPEELFDRVRAHFRDDEIVELTFLIGYINMLNWFNNALEVRYRDEFTGLTVY